MSRTRPHLPLVLLTAALLALTGAAASLEQPQQADQDAPPEDQTDGQARTGDRGDPWDRMEPWEDLMLPPGVEAELIASNLTLPTGIDWDADGVLHVSLVGFTEDQRQILRVDGNGSTEPIDLGSAQMTPQILDLTFHEGQLYWTTTGRVHVKDLETGQARTIVTGLPAWGDHRTDEVVVGPDGRLYVGQGTVTNSGVVGFDNLGQPNAINNVSGERPWYRDVPCTDVRLSGANWNTTNPFVVDTDINSDEGAGRDASLVNFTSEDEVRQWIEEARSDAGPEAPEPPEFPEDAGTDQADRADDLWLTWPETDRERVLTGPFSPFATPTYQGQVVEGQDLCNGAVLSMETDGSDVRPVAWGFRNPFALKFDDQGRLWVADNGPDKRGSRPLGPGPDTIQVVTVGGEDDELPWYGWPDHTMGLPYTDPFFSSPWGPPIVPVFEEDPAEPRTQFTFSGSHASTNKFDFGRNGTAYEGSLFVAEFGSLGIHPIIGANSGMSVNRVDMETGRVTEFIIADDRWGGDFRPVEAAFGPDDRLYVVDFGPATQTDAEGNATHGERYVEEFVPDEGRILAFTLPEEMDWEGRPVGNPGGRGQEPSGGDVGGQQDNATVVEVFDYGFDTAGDVRVGQPVAFRNIGEVGHTATDYYGAFNSGFSLAPDTTFTWTPDEPGTYRFYCGVHPSMQGTLVVAERDRDTDQPDEDQFPEDGEQDGLDEDTPGLGAVAAMVAMLGVGGLLRRRRG